MAEANNSFVRAFLPGLVVGLVVGGIAGAVLPELLAANPMVINGAAGNGAGAGQRDGRDAESPDLPVPAEIPENEQPIDEDGGIDEQPINDALDDDGLDNGLDDDGAGADDETAGSAG